MNLNQHSAEDFEQDVSKNEPLLSQWMDKGWHWFRFPFLAEGDTPEKKAAIRTFLLQHGYKIAGVTMSFGDYRWNEPYARCKAKGDAEGIQSLEQSYLQAAADSITFYRSLSQMLFQRDIPYVLLMHIGAFDGRMMPRLLSLYLEKGFEFIGLDRAERDDFYLQDTDLNLAPGPDSLEGMMTARHLPFPPHATLVVTASDAPENACR